MSAVRQPEWDAARPAADNARRELPALVESYFDFMRQELKKDPPPARLHPLRLATKRLRYTLELFRPCYSHGLEARLEALQTLQKHLGDVNDCVATWDLLKKKMRRSAERTKVRKSLDRRAAKHARAFRKAWRDFFEASTRQEWWTAYFARGAGNSSPSTTPIRRRA
jgi:CHAD domain-containing protein